MPSSGVTSAMLADTLKQLMVKEPFERISVNEIVECCGLNRNSFYYHFKDKYDLVNWVYKTEFIDKAALADYNSNWKLLNAIFEYLYQNRIFYANAISVKGQNSFSDYFKDVTGELLAPYHTKLDKDDKTEAFCTSVLFDAMLTIILRWLEDGAQIPPEKFLESIISVAKVVADSLKDT
jgi:probable dihydroxyacetone kinase regulator